ncbi:MAG: FecR family protein, partial [Betaproteobacteria bacterium]
MRPRSVVAIGFALTFAGLVASAVAQDQDGYRHGRLRYVDPGVTLQRATDAGAEEAEGNEPLLPGDRVWTDASGRAEFQFPDGSLVRLDRRSKLDYSGHEEDGEERIVLRLWSGSMMVHAGSRNAARFEIETPGGTVTALQGSVVRVDVDGGEARVSVYS